MCHGVDVFLLILRGVPCAAWTWITVSFPRLGKSSAIICSNKPPAPVFRCSPGIPMIWTLFCFMESLSSLSVPSWPTNFLSLFFSYSLFSVFLSSIPPFLSSASLILIVTVSHFCISFIAFFISSWLVLRSLFSAARFSLMSSMPFEAQLPLLWLLF